MGVNDPLIQSFLRAVAPFWIIIVVIGAVAYFWLTGTSLIGLIAHGARAVAEFGMNMGVRTLAFAALCVFSLIVAVLVRNITGAPNLTSVFTGPVGVTTGPSGAPVPTSVPLAPALNNTNPAT